MGPRNAYCYVNNTERWKPYERAFGLEPLEQTVQLGGRTYTARVGNLDQARAVRSLLTCADVLHDPEPHRSTVRASGNQGFQSSMPASKTG